MGQNSDLLQGCKKGVGITILFLILSIISIKYIDKPLALFINSLNLSPNLSIANIITEHSLYPLIILEFLIFCCVKLRPGLNSKISLCIYNMFIVYITYILTEKIKMIFGRSWPMVWNLKQGYGALIPDGVFKFNFLVYHNWEGSFPSGHMAFISVTSILMLLCLEKYGTIFLLLIPIMGISIILQNYHFLGDCLGGVAFGSFMAYNSFTLYLWFVKRK